MSTFTRDQLACRRCVPCEGGVPPMSHAEIRHYLDAVPDWRLCGDEVFRLSRQWEAADFAEAAAFLGKVTDLAEAEDHHPDLHLTDYNRVRVDIWTHAIRGLSENDFILAAKIDAIPFKVKGK